ncbi:MAG TPA: TIGR01777 family oxidoreductase [Thermoleophilaceae bacterium]
MKIAVTGATGTIGRALVDALTTRGDEVTALSRDPERAARATATAAGDTGTGSVETAAWADPKGEPPPLDALRGRDGIVHLLGEPIAQRWTDEARREILDSRVLATRNLVAALAELPSAERPRVLVSQSAIGWYGPHGPEPLDESAPAGDDFQAEVVVAWEAEARRAEELGGLRVVRVRTGVVLSPSGGALEKMLPFFKLGIGGPVAGGRQYVPWVHLDDVVGALVFCLDNEAATGAINVTAPTPTTNAELSKALGRVLKRPAFLPVPGLAVKTLYGEMASIVTNGANVQPKRLEELGYEFRQPALEPALQSATGRN